VRTGQGGALTSGLAMLLLGAALIAPGHAQTISDAQALEISQGHCIMCHAQHPTHASFAEPPKNVSLETIAELRQFAPQVAQSMQQRTMPLGNQTEMTEEERMALAAWATRQTLKAAPRSRRTPNVPERRPQGAAARSP
jgi:uncharacterized membrane protein